MLGWILNLEGAPAGAVVPIFRLLREYNDMAIRNQALTVNFLAWNTSTNAGQTGDSANFTLRLIKDGGTPAAPTNSISEPDATNMPGTYELALTATEMDADFVTLHGISSTGNVVIIPLHITTESGDLAVMDANIDSLLTGTISELSQGVPPATPTLQQAVMLMYMALRNKTNVTTSGASDYLEINNDAGTVICKKTLTDDGSDYSEAEMISGP